MKATIKVELQPFQAPNYVRAKEKPKPREAGFEEATSYPLSDLDPNTLHQLCEQFRSEVFKKAGKQQPPQNAPTCQKCGE